MGLFFYNLLLILSLPLTFPVFAIWVLLRTESRAGFSERLGIWPGNWEKDGSDHPRIWIHAASVGECLAVLPLLERWFRERPSMDIIISVMTPAGRRLAEQRMGDRVRVRFFPIDFPGIPARLLRRVAPDMILLVETEIWPNFLRAASQYGIPVLLINGRISPRSYRRYRAARWLFHEALQRIRIFGMQSDPDARRIIALGASPGRVRVSGNLKFDQVAVPLSEPERQRLLKQLGWSLDDHILVAGSTHEKEEELLLTALAEIKRSWPGFRLILAPRHLNRLAGITGMLDRNQIRYVRYSDLDRVASHVPPDILLVDTVGHLGRLYSLGAVVFVGGSLVPVGGHNLLEPAALGRPVLFGPYVQNVQEMADLLTDSTGGRQVRDVEEFIQEVLALLTDTSRREAMESHALETVRLHQGASGRINSMVADVLKGLRSGHVPRRDHRSGIERWFKERLLESKDGIVTALAAAGLRGVSLLYQGWQELRASAYSLGLLRTVQLPRPVISVGNLTLGGTGKTPAVMTVCQFLLAQGRHPVVLSRGYGGRNGKTVRVLSHSTGPSPGPDDVGDEPSLMADRLWGVPVVVSSDRVTAARYALETLQPDVFVLDDGYQHLRLKRDLNLLVVDAMDPFGNGYVFPRGTLRESLHQLGRADAVLLTHVDDPDRTVELQKFIREFLSNPRFFTSRHRIVEFVPLGSGAPFSFESIKGMRILAVAGIGQPDRFIRMLQEGGANPAAVCLYPDHYRFRPEDLEAIETESERLQAHRIVTTEKDAVRIKSLGRSLESWWAARMDLVLDQSEAFKSMLKGVFR